MTIRELIQSIGGHPAILGAAFVALPLLTWALRLMHGRGHGGDRRWKYIYSVLVYAACVPGMFATVVTAYALFFSNENLLDVNLLVYALPILSMVVTLVFVHQSVGFDAVPGFDRLSGLMVLIACSFGLALAIHRTRIFVGFFGSIEHLFLLAGGIFALLKWGGYMLFRRREDPAKERPRFPAP